MSVRDNTELWEQQGRDAAQRGETACPYFAGTVGAFHWMRGWKGMRAEIAQADATVPAAEVSH